MLFNLRAISADCSGKEEVELTKGVLNCRVALTGASVRVDPVDEKTVQVSVIRFAARYCNAVGEY